MALDRLKQKMFNDMAHALAEKAYQEVGERLLAESKKRAEKINQNLKDHITRFDAQLIERVKSIIKDEMR